MKFQRSLCMAIVERENRWLYLFYRVDKDMLQLDRIHVPTLKVKGRCPYIWSLCEHVCAPIILRAIAVVPGSWGCINDSCVHIIQSNVFLSVNSEGKDPGKENRDEQALVDDPVGD